MATQDSLELVRRYAAEVWGGDDPANPDVLRRFLSPSFQRHTSAAAPPLDRETQIERLQGIKVAFPDISITPDDFIAEDDRVAMRATLRGTHGGDFMGIPPTGKEVTATIVDVIRVEDGQFAEQWGGPDVFDMLRQVGATVSGPV